jgi:hypothetical protein
MVDNVNMLRMMSFVAIKGERKSRILVVQELHRSKTSKMKGCPLSMLHKVKRFQKWIDELMLQDLIEPDFFEGADNIMVQNDFKPYNPTVKGLKEKLIKQAQNDRVGEHMDKEMVIDISGYVQLEFRFFNDKGNQKGKKLFLPVNLGDDKADSYDFCKMLVLEKHHAGELELPEIPKGASSFECNLHLEFAPDAKGSYGEKIELVEFELARDGYFKDVFV